MRLLRLILILVIILIMALCVQENAHNMTSMTVFGQPFFTDVSTPIVVFVSVLAGVALGFPLAAYYRSLRIRREKKRDEKAIGAREKKQSRVSVAPPASGSEKPGDGHKVHGYPLNGGS
jgi:uncharacterized integral membrane protein